MCRRSGDSSNGQALKVVQLVGNRVEEGRFTKMVRTGHQIQFFVNYGKGSAVLIQFWAMSLSRRGTFLLCVAIGC